LDPVIEDWVVLPMVTEGFTKSEAKDGNVPFEQFCIKIES
jgi:hypothetical protein